MLLVVEAVTGAALAAFYSPSATDAWASVAYVQDQMPRGWLVRGLHYPRRVGARDRRGHPPACRPRCAARTRSRASSTWWLGIVLLLLVLGFAITGYVLRWDQAGLLGEPGRGRHRRRRRRSSAALIRALAIGGNEYGNLTLTRFYALHVVVLPALVALVASRTSCSRAGTASTPRCDARRARCRAGRSRRCATSIAMAIVFAMLLALHGRAARRRPRRAGRSVGGLRRAPALVLPLAVRAAHARRLGREARRAGRAGDRRRASWSRCRSSIAAPIARRASALPWLGARRRRCSR